LLLFLCLCVARVPGTDLAPDAGGVAEGESPPPPPPPPPAAMAGTSAGAETSTIEKIPSVTNLVANLIMDASCLRCEQSFQPLI
jgi:hypothetical protein